MSNANFEGIPAFRPDVYLPEGVHVCTLPAVIFRFGSGSRQRRRLVSRLRRWVELGLAVDAKKLLIDGSFVTEKPEPNDIDAVMMLSDEFVNQLDHGDEAASELEDMFHTRYPAEIFAAYDEDDWQNWIEFFSRTRETDGRRKGLLEVQL